ncbi:MAG: hypothetical protein HYZ74_07665 [Elusimicrobia bacterium]|nr:hypothetical protein [Elusimicrobiota bacterium]
MLSGVVLLASLSSFAHAAEPVPSSREVGGSGALTLEGRRVKCEGKRDVGGRGYRFEDWRGRLSSDSRGSWTLTFGFQPRFLDCAIRDGKSVWIDDVRQTDRLLVAAVYYFHGKVFGSPLLRVDRTVTKEFPAGERSEATRVDLSFDLALLLNAGEWKKLENEGVLAKELALYPVWKSQATIGFDGVPESVLKDGAWYTAVLTLTMDARKVVSFSKASVGLSR